MLCWVNLFQVSIPIREHWRRRTRKLHQLSSHVGASKSRGTGEIQYYLLYGCLFSSSMHLIAMLHNYNFTEIIDSTLRAVIFFLIEFLIFRCFHWITVTSTTARKLEDEKYVLLQI